MDRFNNFGRVAVLCAVLVGVTLATFWPVQHHEFINFDDPDYVTDNGWVRSGLTADGVQWAFTTGHASNWHPVTWLSHMLDVQWFGLDAGKHHRTNLFLHTANSLLLLLLLWQMTGAVWRSALVAALFALHPLHVESVAWVAERKDMLSTFFGLLCLMAYAKYANVSNVRSLKSKVWYGITLVLLALGLMSKPMLVTWPFVMLLLDVWPLKRLELSAWDAHLSTLKRLAVEKLPFLALVIGSCVVTFLVQHEGGTVTTSGNLPLDDRLANAIVSYVKYLGKIIWPADLAIFYPHPETRYPISEQWPGWLIGIASLFLAGLSVLAWRGRKERPYLLTGWFWYLGTLVPVIGIVQVGTQAMADRYSYVPAIGIFIGLVWLLAACLARVPSDKIIASVAAGAVLVACTIVTRTQLGYWQSSFSVFAHAVAVTRNNAPAHGNLGTEYAKRGDQENAIKQFKAALAADPHFADADCGLGLTAQNQGNLAEAAGYYREALQIRPDHVLAHNNLGTVLWLQGQLAEAENQFDEALRLKPDYVDANVNLGNLLLEQRKPAESQIRLVTALQLRPDNVSARVGLALALKMQGQLAEAETQFREVIRVDPQNLEAALNLGVVLSDLGQTNEAATYLNQVVQAKPTLFEELNASGRGLAAQGKVAAAADLFAAAVRLRPDSIETLEALAGLQAQSGRLDEAAVNFEKALAQHPSAEACFRLGAIRALQGRVTDTVLLFQKAIHLKPDYLAALNELAWLLATHPDEKIRNGQEAVRLAEQACKLAGDKEARYWGTLDAAYAEAGRFPEAIQTAEKTRALALAAGEQSLADAAEIRRTLYLQNEPYRQ